MQNLFRGWFHFHNTLSSDNESDLGFWLDEDRTVFLGSSLGFNEFLIVFLVLVEVFLGTFEIDLFFLGSLLGSFISGFLGGGSVLGVSFFLLESVLWNSSLIHNEIN